MSRRACVFVDGENFRHSIVDLYPRDFNRNDYLPRQARWADLFDWFVSEADVDATRLRTYWYVTKTMDCSPYNLARLRSDPQKLENVLCTNVQCRARLKNLTGAGLTKEMDDIVEMLKRRQNRMQKRFAGWRALQEGIAKGASRVEFRQAGAITYSAYDDSLGKEKAVDVKLATDLIMLRDIYDVAVIVSGDQDYVPAVEKVKDFGKIVVNIAFKTRQGKLLPGGARRLNILTDDCVEIGYRDLANYLNLTLSP